jgi:hypothetical protein
MADNLPLRAIIGFSALANTISGCLTIKLNMALDLNEIMHYTLSPTTCEKWYTK